MKIIPLEKYKMFSGRNGASTASNLPQSRRKLLRQNKFLQTILILFLVFWVLMSLRVNSRISWLIENMLLIGTFLVLWIIYNRIRFSNKSYLFITLFFVFYSINAKYNNAFMPLLIANQHVNFWGMAIYYLYGFMFMVPYMEFSRITLKVKGTRCIFVASLMIICTTSVYKILEMWFLYLIYHNLQIVFGYSIPDQWDSIEDIQITILGLFSFVLYLFLKLKIKEYKIYKKL